MNKVTALIVCGCALGLAGCSKQAPVYLRNMSRTDVVARLVGPRASLPQVVVRAGGAELLGKQYKPAENGFRVQITYRDRTFLMPLSQFAWNGERYLLIIEEGP